MAASARIVSKYTPRWLKGCPQFLISCVFQTKAPGRLRSGKKNLQKTSPEPVASRAIASLAVWR